MKPDKNIILSHAGKQHSYQVAKALQELGYLKKFHTSSYVANQLIQKYFTRKNNQFWTRRFINTIHGNKVEANWRFEFKEYTGRLLKKKSSEIEKLVYERDEKFDNYMSRILLKEKNPIFWGFQGSCLQSLKAVKKSNGFSICELATAHITFAKKILLEEMQLLPEWAESISNVEFPSSYEKRLEQEPVEADLVIAASSFTKFTLTESGISPEKINILPLGASIDHIKYIPDKKKEPRPLKLLYAGTVTQRKGIAYLLEAMKKFKKTDVELHIIGNIFGSGKAFNEYSNHFIYHGSMSQQSLFQKYCEYDALVLPTIFEGFALVIVEAMAAGLPVITTSHSIGPDVIENDKNGYIIPIRDSAAIEQSIIKLRDKTADEWQSMQAAARNAALNYSWENYTTRLNNFLINLNTLK